MITAVPTATAVITPPETVATAGFDELHVTCWPLGVVVAVIVAVSSLTIDSLLDESEIAVVVAFARLATLSGVTTWLKKPETSARPSRSSMTTAFALPLMFPASKL